MEGTSVVFAGLAASAVMLPYLVPTVPSVALGVPWGYPHDGDSCVTLVKGVSGGLCREGVECCVWSELWVPVGVPGVPGSVVVFGVPWGYPHDGDGFAVLVRWGCLGVVDLVCWL